MKALLEFKNWAVVGTTKDTSKFGYKVYKKLKSKGYNVFPVNPGLDEINGEKCYHSVADINDKIDVVSMIINPKIGIDVLDVIHEKGIKNIWCQPGAESQELIDKAKAYGMKIIYNECVLVELR
jgi:predicted CoA-binding protein